MKQIVISSDSAQRLEQYTRSGLWNDDTLSAWLARWATDTPEQPALQFDATVCTYAALEDRVQRVAAG